jgi:hypothetical protein
MHVYLPCVWNDIALQVAAKRFFLFAFFHRGETEFELELEYELKFILGRLGIQAKNVCTPTKGAIERE